MSTTEREQQLHDWIKRLQTTVALQKKAINTQNRKLEVLSQVIEWSPIRDENIELQIVD